jgi:hypothetical protein
VIILLNSKKLKAAFEETEFGNETPVLCSHSGRAHRRSWFTRTMRSWDRIPLRHGWQTTAPEEISPTHDDVQILEL